jgi:glucose/arabinose dehydrogenase
MRFGPDGYLYLALGDGGSGGDPCERAQTLDPADIQTDGCSGDESVALLGALLRLDVDGTTDAGANNLCGDVGDGSANYAIPADNPFVRDGDSPDETRCAEIWMSGLRNPWRFSFDRDNGDVWIGDVGQNQWEEIDRIDASVAGGQNLGWDCYEASSSFESAGCPPDSALTFPVLEYDHASTGGCSVTGGYRYRGPVTSLQGFYIFGDFCSGDVWFADNDSGSWQREVFGSGFGNIRSFGEDEQGNVYAIGGSTIYRFEGTIAELIFADGFESTAR